MTAIMWGFCEVRLSFVVEGMEHLGNLFLKRSDVSKGQFKLQQKPSALLSAHKRKLLTSKSLALYTVYLLTNEIRHEFKQKLIFQIDWYWKLQPKSSHPIVANFYTY